MKDSIMMMAGAALGIGAYIGLSELSKNKNCVKHKMNDLIDDAADMMK